MAKASAYLPAKAVTANAATSGRSRCGCGQAPPATSQRISYFVDTKPERTLKRKRIRGLRRHFRQHQRRAAIPTPLNLTLLTSHHYDYLKLGLSPWYQDGRPPLAFRRLWATQLLSTFWDWHAQLTALGEPFHLAIWLFEPHFGESQLTASVAERRAQYVHAFTPAPTAPLPPAYRHLPGVADLRWSVGWEEWVLDDDEFVAWVRQGFRGTYGRYVTPDGVPWVAVRRGRVWVGQAPE